MQRSRAKRRQTAVASGREVTLEMVATAARVSPSTVSRILNGTAHFEDYVDESFAPDPATVQPPSFEVTAK